MEWLISIQKILGFIQYIHAYIHTYESKYLKNNGLKKNKRHVMSFSVVWVLGYAKVSFCFLFLSLLSTQGAVLGLPHLHLSDTHFRLVSRGQLQPSSTDWGSTQTEAVYEALSVNTPMNKAWELKPVIPSLRRRWQEDPPVWGINRATNKRNSPLKSHVCRTVLSAHLADLR